MVLYTIVPYEKIFEDNNTAAPEMRKAGGGFVELARSDAGYCVSRLISTDPKDYLNEKYSPGAIFPNGGR